MSELSDEDKRILAYLRERAKGGEQYLRSKHIADAIDLTAKQVGLGKHGWLDEERKEREAAAGE